MTRSSNTDQHPAFYCANERCRTRLGVDHVTLATTNHVRRFCSVDCISEGHEALLDAIMADPEGALARLLEDR